MGTMSTFIQIAEDEEHTSVYLNVLSIKTSDWKKYDIMRETLEIIIDLPIDFPINNIISQRERLFLLHNRTDLWCRIAL